MPRMTDDGTPARPEAGERERAARGADTERTAPDEAVGRGSDASADERHGPQPAGTSPDPWAALSATFGAVPDIDPPSRDEWA